MRPALRESSHGSLSLARAAAIASRTTGITKWVPFWQPCSPGNYFLHKDLTFGVASGTAITINSSNVSLDFNGHVLVSTVAPPTNPGLGVAVGTDKKAIENVTVKKRNGFPILGWNRSGRRFCFEYGARR